jgi:hypothetical protein
LTKSKIWFPNIWASKPSILWLANISLALSCLQNQLTHRKYYCMPFVFINTINNCYYFINNLSHHCLWYYVYTHGRWSESWPLKINSEVRALTSRNPRANSSRLKNRLTKKCCFITRGYPPTGAQVEWRMAENQYLMLQKYMKVPAFVGLSFGVIYQTYPKHRDRLSPLCIFWGFNSMKEAPLLGFTATYIVHTYGNNNNKKACVHWEIIWDLPWTNDVPLKEIWPHLTAFHLFIYTPSEIIIDELFRANSNKKILNIQQMVHATLYRGSEMKIIILQTASIGVDVADEHIRWNGILLFNKMLTRTRGHGIKFHGSGLGCLKHNTQNHR